MASCPSPFRKLKRPRLDQEAQAPPTAAEERRLFRLWIEASRLAAASAVRRAQQQQQPEPEADRQARRAAHDAYLDALAALGLEKRALVYDPLRRHFVDHFAGVDPCPSSKLYFQYYPVAAQQLVQSTPSPAPAPHSTLELRVVNHDTRRKAPPCTVATLERYLPRRYRGASPRRVGVLRPAGGGEVDCQVPGVECRVYDMVGLGPAVEQQAEGHGFNRAFLQAVEQDSCEVVYVWRGWGGNKEAAKEAAAASPLTLTEVFFPTYPTLLKGGRLLLLGPLHVYQVDGAESQAPDAIQSLLDRACGVLGAVVVERAAASRLPYMRYDRQRHQRERGLAHARATGAATAAVGAAALPSPSPTPSIEVDARALRITGRLHARRYVPTFPHGWLSDDTAILLATALRVFQPQSVLELGAWLGLSSRFILREGRGSVRRFVSVDHLKNTAVGNVARLVDVAPVDKLYFSHLRFETFYSNMEAHCFGGGDGDGDGEATAAMQAQEQAPPEVVMLRANVHEAPQLMHGAREAVDLVFIDAEKNAGRLARLLQTVQRLYPRAVIVGDDLAFAGVKQALVDVGVPEERLVKRAEAYVILPSEVEGEEGGEEGVDGGRRSRDKATMVAVMEQEVAPRLAVPAWQREIVALIERGEDAEAVALGAAHGLGPGEVLYSPGKTILHDICRRRDEAALAFLDTYIEEELLGKKGIQAEGEEGEEGQGAGNQGPKAFVPVNDIGLTPFDYLLDNINF